MLESRRHLTHSFDSDLCELTAHCRLEASLQLTPSRRLKVRLLLPTASLKPTRWYRKGDSITHSADLESTIRVYRKRERKSFSFDLFYFIWVNTSAT